MALHQTMQSSGAISISDLRLVFGVPGSEHFNRYVPATVPLAMGSFYGVTNSQTGNTPTGGAISLSNFYGAKPGARVTGGYREHVDNSYLRAKVHGYGQGLTSNSYGVQFGNNWVTPENNDSGRGSALGSISYTSFFSTGQYNIKLTGVQLQYMRSGTSSYPQAPKLFFVLFFSPSASSESWMTDANMVSALNNNMSFTRCYVRINSTTYQFNFSDRSFSSYNRPHAITYGTYRTPYCYSWVLSSTIYDSMEINADTARATGATWEIWFD